ncbi:MAG: tetratricopeptide repeat protein [Kordiimonadaceae bacterium]|jgi:HemY protein|nr:tetratricopeptide repeat protein [Kordiimonadaceae bacterium]MBT6035465.1 tetratricopeptide repeat protein [Kordiimonadaceae bacterium]MBT6328161.1 tetratricopeptide repeat protein [Kordiimonadaceae bacterium]MBT7581837.1 tetratricopeptide repeat protein [Kordiimonadaceae bacterium]
MIRLTGYIVLAVFIALCAAWISSNPGQVLITWQGWEVRFSVTVFVFIALLYAFVIWAILWLMKRLNIFAFLLSPKRLAAKRAKAESDLDQAWSEYALGDYKEALKLGLRAKAKLGEDHNVLRLLASATQKLPDEKNPYMEKLAGSEKSAVWAKKQDLDQYLEQKRWAEAKKLVQKMILIHPKSHYLLELDFLLCARLGNWQEANTALQNAFKQKSAITLKNKKHYKAVIDYCLSLEEKAAGKKSETLDLLKSSLKSEPSFSPAAIAAARCYLEQDDKKSAEKILTAIWKIAPNKELADIIIELYPLESSAETFRRIKKLCDSAVDFVESQHLLAKSAIAAEHWPEARSALELIINSNQASKATYQLFAHLEIKQKNDDVAANKYHALSVSADEDHSWKCESCYNVSAHYLPLCKKCSEFNTISWFN